MFSNMRKNSHSKLSQRKIFLSVMIILCFFSEILFSQENSTTTLTIVNAQQTEYKKDEETGNDTILLTGSVELSVKKGEIVSIIKADSVSYDRKTEMLFAEGNVEISTTGGLAGSETATSSSLLMNTSTLEGVFSDGRIVQTQSDAINLPSGSTLIVFSDIFGKSESNTIVFKNSSLTFCDDENPHWHIDATRTWLLPGGEFAFLNAILYVGPVPVFYLPAFYYPKDELIFNPAFGYKERSGYYFNTTTYLMGRKPLNTSSNTATTDTDSMAVLYNFMKQGSLKEQELQGLVLHNLDEDYTGDTSHYLKVMADWYTNVGGMVGIDGVLQPPVKNINSLKFNLRLGFSNTVFYNMGNYMSLSSKGQRYWDKSNFLGLQLPFRYAGNLDIGISNPFRLSLSMPFYSDPYFNSDFSNRQESMDWISLLTSNSNVDDTTVSEVSSFAWKIAASYSPNITGNLKNYISSSNITLNSSTNFTSTSNNALITDERALSNDGWRVYSPERKFYYPSQITPAALNMNMSGVLFQYPDNSSSTSPKFTVQLEKPEDLKTPAEIEKEKALIAKETSSSENKEKTEETKETVEIVNPELPELSASIPALTSINGLTYRLSYNLSPSLNTQISYNTPANPDEIKWDNIKSTMYTIKAPVSVSSSLSYGGSFFTMNNSLSYEPMWQKHPNTDGYEDSQKESLILADYNAETQNISNTNSISFKPFILIPGIAESSLNWNTSMKLFRRKFTGDWNNPEWENLGLDFSDPESVTTNTFDFKLSANEMNSKFTQVFTYSTTISPQIPRHSFNLSLGFPYVTASVGTGFQETSLTDNTIIYNPLAQSLSVSLFDNSLKLYENWSWNYNEGHSDTLRLSANWKGFSTAFLMSYTNSYDFDKDSGWVPRNHKEFVPSNFSLSYASGTKNYKFFDDNVTFSAGVNTSIVADLLRPTNSYLTFSPSITFKINDFFNISFSTTSRNSVIYRYCQSMFGADGRIPGEQNMFVDLWNSFRFDDVEKRKASGFKLKSLNLEIDHELHDWDFSMSMKFEPRLVTKNGLKYYDYNPYISLGIFWRPMSSMKTQIVDEYGTVKLQ